MRSTLLLSPNPQKKKKKKKKKEKKTQVISVGVNPQRPNMVIRPTCYASHELIYDNSFMITL